MRKKALFTVPALAVAMLITACGSQKTEEPVINVNKITFDGSEENQEEKSEEPEKNTDESLTEEQKETK
nr:hypothetical protein [Lachnospiraceae bacterium]